MIEEGDGEAENLKEPRSDKNRERPSRVFFFLSHVSSIILSLESRVFVSS